MDRASSLGTVPPPDGRRAGSDPARREHGPRLSLGRIAAAVVVAVVALVSLPLGPADAAPRTSIDGATIHSKRSAPATVTLAVSDGRRAVGSRVPRLLATFGAAWCIVLLTATYVRLAAARSRSTALQRHSGARAPPVLT